MGEKGRIREAKRTFLNELSSRIMQELWELDVIDESLKVEEYDRVKNRISSLLADVIEVFDAEVST